MAATKCTKVARQMVNHYLEVSAPEKQRERYALAHFLEGLTLTLNDYHGFIYLREANARMTPDGFMSDDDSRRKYHGEVEYRQTLTIDR